MEPIRTTLNCATHGIPAPPGSRILRLLVLAERGSKASETRGRRPMLTNGSGYPVGRVLRISCTRPPRAPASAAWSGLQQ